MHTAQTTLTLKKSSDDLAGSSLQFSGRLSLAGTLPAGPAKRARVYGELAELPGHEHFQPPAFLRKLKNAAIGTGCDIRLKVAVTGSPVPALAWFKNNRPLPQDPGEYGALWIRDCKPADAGVYTCIARNRLGDSRTSAVLAVLELDSEECGEEETFEAQKADPSERPLGPQQGAAQRVPAGEFESFADTSPESSPSSLRTAPDQPPPSERPGAWRSPAGSRSGAGGEEEEEEQEQQQVEGKQEEREFRTCPSRGSPRVEVARDLGENTLVRSHLDNTREPSLRWETMAQSQGMQQGASRTPGLPPTALKARPASPKASRAGQPLPTTPLTPRRKLSTPAEYRDTVPSEFEDKVRRPKDGDVAAAAAADRLPAPDRARRDSPCGGSPAHSRSGSKIFDRVKYFEAFPERRRSFELADGQPWPGFRKSRSFDHADGRSRPSFSDLLDSEGRGGATGRGADGGSGGNAEQRRSLFKQKAASFDERGRYGGRARDIELKISEELSRIKRTAMSSMAKPVLRSPLLERAVNRELSSRKAAALQRAEATVTATALPWPGAQSSERTQPQAAPASVPRKPLQRGLATATGEFESLETAGKDKDKSRAQQPAVNHFDQRSDEAGWRELHLEAQIPQSQHLQAQPGAHAPSVEEMVEKRTSSSESQAPITISVVRLREPPSPVSMETAGSPLGLEGARLDLGLGDGAPRLGIAPLSRASTPDTTGSATPAQPAGLTTGTVDEKVPETVDASEETKPLVREVSGRKTPRGKSKKSRPTSPELESSDDSYVSAGEDPLEPPVFEIAIADTLVTVGAAVLLKCIITGTPMPEVVWKKDGEILKTSQTHLLKAEGERHTLSIPSASTLDGGLYSVSAANEVGLSSCCASVQVRADSAADRRSLVVATELYSPITSDEEYLSPLEDPTDLTYKGKQALRLPETCEQQTSYEPQSVIETHFKAPPSFEVPLSDQSAVEGQNISLTVHVLGEPKPIIYWLRNREPVRSDSRHYVLEGENGRFHLNIVAVQRSDSGMYSCKAINEYGTKHCDGKLEVKGRRDDQTLTVVAPARDIAVNAGESACFECEIRGPPDVDVDWLTNGKLVQPALLNCKMHFDGKRCKLLLNSVHEDDTGVYTCKLSTTKDEKTCSAQLTVLPSVSPLFTRKLEDVVVIEGRTAHLVVKVSGTPPPTVVWMHFGEKVVETEEVRIVRDQGLHSLLIMHAVTTNEGEYSAIAQNSHGDAFCSAELYVEEPRPVVSSPMAKLEKMPSIPEEPEIPENEMERFTMPDFIKPIQNIEVTEGKDAVLECQVTGLPYPTITWCHNGHRLESTEDRRMTQYKDIHRLVIRSVEHTHAGVYKSVIANKLGKATSYAHIYVSDVVPDPPNGPAVVAGVTGRTVTLKWNKPKKLDPSIDPTALTYVIQSQVVGTAQWHVLKSNIRDTTYTIQSLNKGIQYLFRIQSATSRSCSKPSPVSEPVKLLDRGPYLEEAPCIMDKPDAVFAVENQSACITCTLNYVQADVTWTRNGVELTNKPRLYELSMTDDDQHMLRMVKVGKAEVGEIIVTASNSHGGDMCRIALLLAEAPRFESIMEDIVVSPEETARLAIVVEGKPLPDIHWYKDDEMLVESNHLSFVYDDSECSLVILNTTESDSGVYTCTAKNLAGEVSCKAELTVLKGKTGNDEPMDDEDTILRKMRLLSDYYDVHQEIGRGAFSCVKRVTEKSSKLDYAAKFISFRATAREDAVRELEILSQLDHERIVYFHDAFEKKNSVIIVLEHCAQEELFDRLIKRPSILETELRLYVRQILEGISYLHQNNILHLDIKPDNILMADTASESVRICDLGSAREVIPDTPQFCQFGTPEYVSPEIVNQTPVSHATDIWPVGVIAYIGLTGISPFFSESDKATLLNVKNYHVAFEEMMFASLSRESRGFVIRLLVEDKQRPDADECLQHPWFSSIFTVKGKVINTDHLKVLVSRRKWQRSLINYKSSMVMRSIPELVEDTSGHVNIGIPKHLKQQRLSSVLSSSSDSDEIDEFPFIPMPLQTELLASRLPVHQIPRQEEEEEEPAEEEESSEKQNGGGPGLSAARLSPAAPARPGPLPPPPAPAPEQAEGPDKRKENGEPRPEGGGVRPRPKLARKRSTEAEPAGSSDEEEAPRKPGAPKRGLRKGASIDTPDGLRAEAASRRGELRRGSSADSALALLGAQEGGVGTEPGAGGGGGGPQPVVDEGPGRLKKSASMELPRRSPSPGRLDELAAQRRKGGPAQEDYALKLELMRQRLLRGGSVDSKMSGLRGPLLEHLGIPDDPKQRSSSLERHTLRPPRPDKMAAGPPRLARAASSESAPSEEAAEGRVLRKSASFSQGEPAVLHRRLGAPLEIPQLQTNSRHSPEPTFPLKESPSLSALTDPSKFDTSRPPTPVRGATPKEAGQRPPTPEIKVEAAPESPKAEEQKAEVEGPYRKTMIGRTAVITHSNLSAEPVLPPTTPEDEPAEAAASKAGQRKAGLPSALVPAASRTDQQRRLDQQRPGQQRPGQQRPGQQRPDQQRPDQQRLDQQRLDQQKPSQQRPTRTQAPLQPPAEEIKPALVPPLGQPGGQAAPTPDLVGPTPRAPPSLTSGAAAASRGEVAAKSQQGPAPWVVQLSPPSPPAETGRKADPAALQPAAAALQHPAVFAATRESPVPREGSPSPPETPAGEAGTPALAPQEAAAAAAKDPPAAKMKVKSSSLGQFLNIENIESEELFEAKFKRARESSSLTRSLKHLMRPKSEEKLGQGPQKGENVYRPGVTGAPLQVLKGPEAFLNHGERKSRSRSEQNIPEAAKDSSFVRKLSLRFKGAPASERKEEKASADQTGPAAEAGGRKLSWSFGRGEAKEQPPEPLPGPPRKERRNSPALAVRRKIESTISGISLRFARSQSEERVQEVPGEPAAPAQREGKRGGGPFLSLLRRATSEAGSLKKVGIPQNQLAMQTRPTPSSESLQSETSVSSKQDKASTHGERRSRWDRWGFSRMRRDKAISQPNISLAVAAEDISMLYHRSASDFPPVFHVKLKDHMLLDGDPLTLCSLPAGSPSPNVTWSKDQRSLLSDDRIKIISCADGRQLVTILKSSKKDVGVYECAATNPLGMASSCCTVSLARLPGRPGPPEIPQKYRNTALVLWKPADTPGPCSYTLEQKLSGEERWTVITAGIPDCFFNATELTGGSLKFRVACVNKAGQGPYSQSSERIVIEDEKLEQQPAVTSTISPVPVYSAKVTPPPIPGPSATISLTTVSPAPSKTISLTPSPTVSPAPSKTISLAPSPTVSPTPSKTISLTPSPTVSPTPSKIISLAPSTTVSPTPSKTISLAPSTTVSPTPSKTISLTPSPTVSPTPSKTISLAPSPTVAPTPSKTISLAPSKTVFLAPSKTISLAPSPTVSPTPSKTISLAPSTTVSPTPSKTISLAPSKTVSLAPSKIIFPAPLKIISLTPSPTVAPAPPKFSPTAPSPVTPAVSPFAAAVSPPLFPASSAAATALPPSVSPVGSEESVTPTRLSPTSKPADGSAMGLRHGVPQKPYTFMEEKARGRFGVVRECKENATGKIFMAKIIHYEGENKQAVLQEYEVLKALHHEKIMCLHEAYVTPRYLVLISENCLGKEILYSLIDRFRYSEDDVVGYILQVLQGLEYLHSRRIVHLDIKPDNVIITYLNVVKLVDFGSAHFFNATVPKPLGHRVGTPENMSPEMVKGDPIGPPADIWGLGVLIYIMLSGRSPFGGPDPTETDNRIKMAQFDLTKCYPNASQNAALFLKRVLCMFPATRPTVKECHANPWLQDNYLMKLRRQTLTFTTARLKEFLVHHQRKRTESLTRHRVLLRSYSSASAQPGTPAPSSAAQ
uniref:striated muscle-specific serine/threonine-protein kinase-like n=1 Tax=Pristiophorus japonicus TaxID=55135 RepID=UPI00398E4D6C